MTTIHAKVLIVSVAAFVLGASAAFVAKGCTDASVTVWSNRESRAPGYVLAALFSTERAPGTVLLLDARGRAVHTWRTEYQPLVAYLKENGHIVVALADPSIDAHAYPSAGSTGTIQELDWDGNVVWEYSDAAMTHDFELLPDGIAYIRWHRASPAFAARVKGGQSLYTKSKDVWTNEIVVVNTNKDVVWKWRLDEHVDPSRFVLNPLTPRDDWAHFNSIRYTEQNPITGTPAFLVSARNVDAVFLIDRETGTIIWTSPKGLLSRQHDATITPEGNILVFDNGMNRLGHFSKELIGSRVIEINPKTNKIAWEYSGGATPLESGHFYSSIMSGAQRLANGNTLVTASMIDTIVEVTPEKEIAWKYTRQTFIPGVPTYTIFKARKYDPAGTVWEDFIQMPALVRACNVL